MKPPDVSLGLVPLARPTFDLVLATQITAQVRAQLEEAGYSLTGRETLVSSLDEAEEVAQELADNPPDLLLVFQATFADSTMVMSLAQAVDAPLFLYLILPQPFFLIACGLPYYGFHVRILQGIKPEHLGPR